MCWSQAPGTAHSLSLPSRTPQPRTHPHNYRDVPLADLFSYTLSALQQQPGPALEMTQHCQLCSGSSPSQLEWGSCLCYRNIPMRSNAACLRKVLIPEDLATTQSLHPDPTNRPRFCGLLLLGSKTPVYKEKARAGLRGGLHQTHRQVVLAHLHDMPAGAMGRAAASLWLFPFQPLQECLCTSPGFSSAFVLLLVQIGESQACLQPEGEIPNGNQPSSQQGQCVPFGLT